MPENTLLARLRKVFAMEQKNAISRRLFLGGTVAGSTALLLSTHTLAPFAFADPVSEKQAEADEAYQKLLEMQAVLDRASNNYHRAVEAQEEAQLLMEEARQRIEGESITIAECQEQLSVRAHDMYRAGPGSFLDVLLGSRTFEEFATNWDMLNTLNAADAALVKRSKESRQALANAKATFAIQRETAAHEAAAAKEVHDEAMVTVSDMEAVYESLSAEASALLANMEAEQATITDQETLNALIEQGAAAQAEWMAAAGEVLESSPLGGEIQAPSQASGIAGVAGSSSNGSAGHASGNIGAANTGNASGNNTGGSTSSNASTTTPVRPEPPAPEPEPTPEPEPAPVPEPEPEPEPAPAPEPEPEPEPIYVEPEPEPEPVYSAPVVNYNVDLGTRVVNIALQYLGWPYVWGGKSPAMGGFDCSGFVGYCYEQAGSWAPAWTGSLISWGYEVYDPQPGDVCVIHELTGDMRQHTGIYYGGGQMIHAATFGVGVIIGPVQAGMTYRRAAW